MFTLMVDKLVERKARVSNKQPDTKVSDKTLFAKMGKNIVVKEKHGD